MLNTLLWRIRGQCRVRFEAAFPERVLNLLSARGIAFWDLVWESPTEVSCRISRRDRPVLAALAERADARVEVLRGEGLPFFLGRFRRRQALLVGLGLCLTAMMLGSFFIWEFTIAGNETVTEEEILRALERNGVRRGTFGLAIDAEDLRNHVLLEIPELCWITVNVSGSRGLVQVRERVHAPELQNRHAPANVVARRGGLIRKVQALAGKACVLPGTAVEEGELLISGVEDTETVGAHMMPGMGSVEARTWYTLTTVMPLEETVREPVGRARSRYALVVGTRRIKFFGNSGTAGGNYDKLLARMPWSLFGLPLPVTWVRERVIPVAERTRRIPPKEAEARAKAILTEYLHTQVDPYGSVRSSLCSARVRDGALEVTLQAECLEEIGRRIPIYMEDPPGKRPATQQE